MKFKVGDKVTIKSVKEIYNIIKENKLNYHLRYISYMEQFSGKTYTIKKIDLLGYIYFDEKYNTGENIYGWHPTWIEIIHEEFFKEKDFTI